MADCYGLKMRDIGARIVTEAVPMKIEADELKMFAPTRPLDGCELGGRMAICPARDDAKRLHPDIVSYDDLSEQDANSTASRSGRSTRLLSHAGRRALRTLVVGIAPVAIADADRAGGAPRGGARENVCRSGSRWWRAILPARRVTCWPRRRGRGCRCC
ncbi:hypothetical protein AB5I41_12160 [Sphingomonas sp. MMS24-JH45]